MARLPEPGGDAGQWGEILNDFLSQSISADGSLNISSVGSVQLKPNAVTTAAIADDQVTSSKLADGSVTTAKIADGQITASKIADGAVGGNQLTDNSVTPAKTSAFGQASGFASLDVDGRLPEGQVPTRLSESGLSDTIAAVTQPLANRRAATIAALGDSFTAQNGPPGGYGPTAGAQWYPGNGWLDWAITFLHKRVIRRGIFGVGGNTTAQILARVGDVIALNPRPTYCVVQGGTNDTNLNVPAETTIANQKATCEALIEAGITPILVSVPPVPYVSAGQLASVSAVLSWQKTYARETPGLIYCDWRRYIAKPDGTWRTGFSDDAIHPNSVGCSRMGWALAETLKPLIAKVDTLSTQNNDPKLVNENPMMVGTAGTLGAGVTGQAPDIWNIETWVGDSTVTAVSSVEEDALTGERSWKVALTGGSVQLRRQRNVGQGWAVGDKVYAECEFEFDSGQPFSNIDKVNLQVDVVQGASGTTQDPNAPSSDAANSPAASFMSGVFRTPVLTVPEGATVMSAKFIVRRKAGSTPAATFRVRRFAWRKV